MLSRMHTIQVLGLGVLGQNEDEPLRTDTGIRGLSRGSHRVGSFLNDFQLSPADTPTSLSAAPPRASPAARGWQGLGGWLALWGHRFSGLRLPSVRPQTGFGHFLSFTLFTPYTVSRMKCIWLRCGRSLGSWTLGGLWTPRKHMQ